MTCIVGVQHDGDVYIGGDSAGVAGYSITVRSDQKVFRNGPFVMGFTSSFRMGQLLRYSFTPPAVPDKNLDRYMSVDFVDGVRECLKDGGFLTNHGGQEVGGTFLVGIRDQLYLIDSDFQVGKPTDGYDAVGCGEEFAKGSLYSTIGNDPKLRVREALKAASHHSAGVTGPYTVLKTAVR
jgi:ATP-dependent protease HslVU (ClpYQ) peptidase subunit